jgi:cytoskeletal protein RodZ
MRNVRARRLLFVAVACVVLVAVGVGGFMGGRVAGRRQSDSPTTTSLTGKASSSSTTSTTEPSKLASAGSTTTTTARSVSLIVTATVPVVTCPTTWGIEPSSSPKRVPRSVTLSLTSSLVGEIEDYTDDREGLQLIGPKGWTCEAALRCGPGRDKFFNPPSISHCLPSS